MGKFLIYAKSVYEINNVIQPIKNYCSWMEGVMNTMHSQGIILV